MSSIKNHPEKSIIRAQLWQNVVLKGVEPNEMAEPKPFLSVMDHEKGDLLLHWRA